MRSGEIMLCHDAERNPQVDLASCRRLGVRSILVSPLRHYRRTLGVFEVLSSSPGAFNQTSPPCSYSQTMVAAISRISSLHRAQTMRLRAKGLSKEVGHADGRLRPLSSFRFSSLLTFSRSAYGSGQASGSVPHGCYDLGVATCIAQPSSACPAGQEFQTPAYATFTGKSQGAMLDLHEIVDVGEEGVASSGHGCRSNPIAT